MQDSGTRWAQARLQMILCKPDADRTVLPNSICPCHFQHAHLMQKALATLVVGPKKSDMAGLAKRKIRDSIQEAFLVQWQPEISFDPAMSDFFCSTWQEGSSIPCSFLNTNAMLRALASSRLWCERKNLGLKCLQGCCLSLCTKCHRGEGPPNDVDTKMPEGTKIHDTKLANALYGRQVHQWFLLLQHPVELLSFSEMLKTTRIV